MALPTLSIDSGTARSGQLPQQLPQALTANFLLLHPAPTIPFISRGIPMPTPPEPGKSIILPTTVVHGLLRLPFPAPTLRMLPGTVKLPWIPPAILMLPTLISQLEPSATNATPTIPATTAPLGKLRSISPKVARFIRTLQLAQIQPAMSMLSGNQTFWVNSKFYIECGMAQLSPARFQSLALSPPPKNHSQELP